MYQEGKYSGGQTIVGPLSSELCVPLGLCLPDTYEFVLNNEKDYDPITVSEISDAKMDDLFNRVAHKQKTTSKRKTRKSRVQ